MTMQFLFVVNILLVRFENKSQALDYSYSLFNQHLVVARLYEEMKRKREESKVHSSHVSDILPYLHDPAALAMWLQRQVSLK